MYMAAAFKLQLWPKAKRPSDVQQWPAGADRAGFACEGPSEQRAAQRSAARRSRSGGPKNSNKKQRQK
ncbi:hypothetical protein SGRA_0320 [Saprospira grandis str. Lewin]|uniref:Uncharacterized protein n=1 Tax=Saprospira grandis (strain Lewin) TaxID=984262 RepID=H6L7M7_SAPGL|nr:hypothetical protein SGRA_0320 [Saprospira grandis str. Lewin]